MIDCHLVPQRTAAKISIKSTSIEGQCKITCDLQSRVKIIKVIKSRSACKHELSSRKWAIKLLSSCKQSFKPSEPYPYTRILRLRQQSSTNQAKSLFWIIFSLACFSMFDQCAQHALYSSEGSKLLRTIALSFCCNDDYSFLSSLKVTNLLELNTP